MRRLSLVSLILLIVISACSPQVTPQDSFANCIEQNSPNWVVIQVGQDGDTLVMYVYMDSEKPTSNLYFSIAICREKYYPEVALVSSRWVSLWPVYAIDDGKQHAIGYYHFIVDLSEEQLSAIKHIGDSKGTSDYLNSERQKGTLPHNMYDAYQEAVVLTPEWVIQDGLDRAVALVLER